MSVFYVTYNIIITRRNYFLQTNKINTKTKPLRTRFSQERKKPKWMGKWRKWRPSTTVFVLSDFFNGHLNSIWRVWNAMGGMERDSVRSQSFLTDKMFAENGTWYFVWGRIYKRSGGRGVPGAFVLLNNQYIIFA